MQIIYDLTKKQKMIIYYNKKKINIAKLWI